MSDAFPSCPKCGCADSTPSGLLKSSVNVWVWLLGGWLMGILFGASRKKDRRCAGCDHVFQSHTLGSRVMLVLFILLVLLILFSYFAQFMGWDDA